MAVHPGSFTHYDRGDGAVAQDQSIETSQLSSLIILGGGMTGLAAGLASKRVVYEASDVPGGICASYYCRPHSAGRLADMPAHGEVYRFEKGGGHWIHSGDSLVTRFMQSIADFKSYVRRTSVFFEESRSHVPYPLQNNLRYLPENMRARILAEIVKARSLNSKVTTMADWLIAAFGPTLYELFFEPFHRLYTAGLWEHIAPQDFYKSPDDLSTIVAGAFGEAGSMGYNAEFVYPVHGLNHFASSMASRADVRYNKEVIFVDVQKGLVHFADETVLDYDALVSTIPLNRMLSLTGLKLQAREDPHTSVLVVNIGGIRGTACPNEHWVYIPRSRSGFHRVGFYSNVDTAFLPKSSQNPPDRVSMYVEVAYRGDLPRPSEGGIKTLTEEIIRELCEWQWVEAIEVADATWIDVAYTWMWPNSQWRTEALGLLESYGIYQVGRYARWTSGTSQGIVHSLRDGLLAGATVRSELMR